MERAILVTGRASVHFFLAYDVAPLVADGEVILLGDTSASLPRSVVMHLTADEVQATDGGTLLCRSVVAVRANSESREAFNARLRVKWKRWAANAAKRIEAQRVDLETGYWLRGER